MSIFNTYDRGESRLVVPASAGRAALAAIRSLLVNADTGGFLETMGTGAWRDEREAVHIFDVAGLPFAVLRQCAEISLMAGQTDVYIRLPNGTAGWFNASPLGRPVSREALSGAHIVTR